jgi:magnesium transporter
MTRLAKKMSKKAGLPPGTLVHVGVKTGEPVNITLMDYTEGEFQEERAEKVEECFPFKDKPTVTWINVDGVHQVEIIEKIGKEYDIHPLVLEDIVNTDQRPKLEEFDEFIFVVLKMLNWDDENAVVQSEQVSLLIGPNFVISFQERPGDVFDPIRDRLRQAKGRIRKMRADYLAYALVDAIVDNYFVVLERLGDRIELVQEDLVGDPTPESLLVIQGLKRELLFLRKSVWPLREVASGLERSESPIVCDSTRVYLRDVYDHTIQVIDALETCRDLVSGMLDIYLSSISNKMNEVMKTLTIIATIFIPLTFVAGLYGMNFEFMPELHWRLAYPLVLLVMVVIGILMMFYFRRKRWL